MHQSENKHSKLTLGLMFAYSIGNIGAWIVDSVFDQWTLFFYAPNPANALAPIKYIGIALFFGRFVDAISNVFVGYWSDRFQSRLGRRIPFILLGTLPMLCFFVLLFRPIFPYSTVKNALYAAVMSGGLFFFYTYVVAPYLALLPEIARSSESRVKLSTIQALCGVIGLIVGMGVSGPLISHFGYLNMALAFAGISLFSFFTPVVFVKETKSEQNKQVQLSFWQAILPSFKNKLFINYVLTISTFWVGFKVFQSSINYIVKIIMEKSEDFISIVMVSLILVSVICFPLVISLTNKYGKKKMFLYALLAISLISPLLGLIKFVHFMSPILYGTIIIALLGIPVAFLLVLPNAILADIIDSDEKITGFRREAMFYGMEGLFTKTARGLGQLSTSFLFGIFGYSTAQHTGILLAGPYCALFVLIGFFIFRKYQLER